jgi:hypothetical protein
MRFCDSWLSVSHHLSTMVVVITISVPQQRPLIRSSSALSRRCSLGQRIPLMLMYGSEWWNPNSHCLMEFIQMWPMQPVDHVVEWGEFKASFRGHYIPAGIMDRKLNEFLALTQGNRTVMQYA